MNTATDRNFDDIANHFAHKVYGSLKGQIRLAVLQRDLDEALAPLAARLGRALRILDIGAGLGQIGLHLAALGHELTLSDVSANMLAKAKAAADAQGLSHRMRFIVGAYQALDTEIHGQYDVILCHALLEWLAEPVAVMAFFERYLTAGGLLSLCFYNPAAPVYRNLIMGNFHHLKQPKAADTKSLTPNHPTSPETVHAWLSEYHYHIISESGIRVFYDYTVHKRGGLAHPEAVIDMELQYSRQLPFRLMGRYLHIIAQRHPTPSNQAKLS